MRSILVVAVLICVSIVSTSNAYLQRRNYRRRNNRETESANSKKITVTPITPPVQLGEGPYWSEETQELYFVDILAGKVHKLDPKSRKLSTYNACQGTASFVIGVQNRIDQYIVGCVTNVTLMQIDNNLDNSLKYTRTLTSVDVDRSDTRFNDAKADSVGRLWGGTMGPEINSQITMNRGSLYSIDSTLTAKKQASPVSISNGLAWNSDNSIMYFIDSPTRKVIAYNYDSVKGSITNPQVVFDFNQYNLTGVPDGMTIDTNDNLWVAQHNGGAVLHVDPRQKKLLNTISIPAIRVTSVAFGDALFDTLYVTSAKIENAQEASKEPHGGCVFSVKGLGVRGLAPNKFKLDS